MRDRSIARMLRAVVVVGGGLAIAGSGAFVVVTDFATWLPEAAVETIMSVFAATIVWLVASGQPRNRVVWAMAVSALFGGISVVLHGAALLIVDDPGLVVGTAVIAADLPRTAAWLMVSVEPSAIVTLYTWLIFGLLLFPDGRLPSSRWRWVGIVSAISLSLLVVASALTHHPTSSVPAVENEGPLLIGTFLVSSLSVVLALAALIVRFRNSLGATRDQFKWVVWGAAVFVPAVVAAGLLSDTAYIDLLRAPVYVALAVFLAAYGTAVGKYRLFDIDVVINKTVMVAGLGAIIGVSYIGVVVGLGSLLGSYGTEFGVQVTATVVVAVAFGPARRWAQRWANRAVYGERSTPYEVLARFSHRAAEASDDELLARIPRLIVDGTGAAEAALWVRSTEGFRLAAAWPEDANRSDLARTDSFEDPRADFSLPVFHDGELLGGLSLVKTRGEALPPAEEQLVANLAAGMGLALRNTNLTSQLRGQVAELEASRERVLVAADEARRALERDLDSGPQQQLVALKVMLGPTRKMAAQAGATRTAEVLAKLEADAGEAIRAVREFSGGVYPPLLEAEGLRVALIQQTEKAAVPITVLADSTVRYPREVEAAVYFTILEALQNIAKYAGASMVSVVLEWADGTLSFAVTDDGAGFDPSEVVAGSGLANMADRLDAVGGRLVVESAPGLGTTVSGRVPVAHQVTV